MDSAPVATGIIVGATRPGRKAGVVAEWVGDIAAKRDDVTPEVVDIADYDLPLFDEPVPPMAQQYSQPHTLRWSETIARFDAFVFVTPEYNHSLPGALKNALDYLFAEWNDKAAGIVGYGVGAAAHAGEHLRQICGELKLADVRSTVGLTLADDFREYTHFAPAAGRAEAVDDMLDELVSWGRALRAVRAG